MNIPLTFRQVEILLAVTDTGSTAGATAAATSFLFCITHTSLCVCPMRPARSKCSDQWSPMGSALACWQPTCQTAHAMMAARLSGCLLPVTLSNIRSPLLIAMRRSNGQSSKLLLLLPKPSSPHHMEPLMVSLMGPRHHKYSSLFRRLWSRCKP